MAEIIKTEGLTKHYGKTIGIEDLDLEVKEGEIFGFLGPNGAGKTTTIRLLLGLILPTRGSASIFGMDVRSKSVKIHEEIGYIPGDVKFYPRLTGGYLIEYARRFKPDKELRFKDDLIKRFDLDVTKHIAEYSRGNKQKLAIILALMFEPKLLVLDEPTLGLDPFMQREFYQVLKEMRKKRTTIFLSSHILSEVERVCDRVGIVREGKLAAIEDIRELASKKIHQVEVAFEEAVSEKLFDMPQISSLIRHNNLWRFNYKGDLNPLLQVLSSNKVTDLEVGHASLEEIFFEFYGKGESK